VNSTIKWLLRAVETLAWTLFFAFAVVVLVLRFRILPDIERYHDDIVSIVSATIGQPVKLGAIRAGWLGLRPQVNFYDVRVYDSAGREALVLPEVENVLSWRSLLRGGLRLHSLVIDHPRLAVRRDADGAFYVAGIKLESTAGGGGLADWILDQNEIAVRNAQIDWLDEKRKAPLLELAALDFRLANRGSEHSIGFSARPPPALGAALDVRAELAGRTVSQLSAWNGRVYVELGATDLAGWRSWIDYPIDVQRGQGALRFWATLQNGQPRDATLDLELARVVARLGRNLPPFELASLSGRVRAQEREGGYEVSAHQLAFAPPRGPAMSPADFRVAWRPAGALPEGGSASANAIEIEPLAHMAESLPLPPELRKRLADLAPRGHLLDAKVDWTGPPTEPTQYSGRVRFADLAIRAWERVPGFDGLAGALELSDAKGSLRIAARKSTVEIPGILAEPRIAFDVLNAQLDWERKADRIALNLVSLAFANADAEGRASGTYVTEPGGRGTIDLTAQLSRAEGTAAARYLPPPPILNEPTYEWLKRAIVSGRGSDAHLRLRGNLRDFPFVDPATGDFQVSARVEKGVLDYLPGWPRIEDIDAQLLFDRDRMEVTGRSGTILGAKLANVRAGIPKLARGAHLLIAGQAEGPTSEFLRYLDASPVGRMLGDFTSDMSAIGRGRLNIKLDIPLGEAHATKVAGDYEFLSNTVSLQPGLPPVERVGGKVAFTESSSTVRGVHGRIFGGTVTVSGGSQAGAGVDIAAKGDALVAAMQPVLDHPWRRFLGGSFSYAAGVSVRGGRTRIAIDSSLRGVSSALPPPLAKSGPEALPLHLELFPSEGGTRDRISVTLGRLARAEFLRRRQGEGMSVQRAAVAISPGGEAMRLPERPGTLVYGSLPALDADRWLGLGPGSDAELPALALDLKLGVLDIFGRRLHDVAVRAGADAAGWSSTVEAKELAGDVSYRNERGGQLVARLARFAVPEEYPGAARGVDATRARDLPSLDIAADQFSYRGKQFGRVEIVAQHAPGGWRIDRVAMVNPDGSISGRGVWQTVPPVRTSLQLTLEAGHAGELLARFGYPKLVKGGKAHMEASAEWAGEPMTIDYPTLTGHVKLDATDGQFQEIEPGLGKLISLMSLQALPRRLTLDFRDVFSKGFQFDRIGAAAHVERGQMSVKDFKMRGSAAEVEMTGGVDLTKETQNLSVRVVPSIGDSASTALLLVNPLLAFPAALAQKILKDPLGHIFAFNYSITGSWSDPKVVKTGATAQSVRDEGAPPAVDGQKKDAEEKKAEQK